MVLLLVLIFLQVLSLLGLLLLQIAWIQIKQSQYLLRKETNLNLIMGALGEIESSEISTDCIIPVTFTAILEQYPLSWWSARATCAGNFQGLQYYYVVENLGLDPCAVVQEIPGKIIANYFRVTVVGINADVDLMLQSTLIKPLEDSVSKCDGQIHTVKMGRQMWRELVMNKENGYDKFKR
jgi:hypothetical protein